MNSPTVTTNGGSAPPPFDVGSKYESWTRHASLSVPLGGPVVGVILEAPDDVVSAQPFVFLHRMPGADDTVEYRAPTAMFLAIEVAHRWATTGVLDEIPEAAILALLATFALESLDADYAAAVINQVFEVNLGTE